MGRQVDQEAVLRDLHTWGADLLDTFKSRVGEEVAAELVLDRSVRLLEGTAFTYVMLGRKGRQQLGLHLNNNHKITSRAAVMHIMRREAKAKLEQLGMRYVGTEDRVLRRFESAEQKTYFLAVSDKGRTAYTARAVRRLLKHYQALLLQTRGVLIVATPQPGRLSKTVAKNKDVLKTLKVDGSLSKEYAQSN